VVPAVAGPKRPQDRIDLKRKKGFARDAAIPDSSRVESPQTK